MEVTLQVGSISQEIPGLVGKTVGEVRSAFETLYKIERDAVATLNTRPAAENDVLREGDVLNFGKPLASKG